MLTHDAGVHLYCAKVHEIFRYNHSYLSFWGKNLNKALFYLRFPLSHILVKGLVHFPFSTNLPLPILSFTVF